MTDRDGRPDPDFGDLAGRLLASARDLIGRAGIPGAAIAVWRDGRPIVEAAVGSADLAGLRPLAGHACFPVYSVTKTFIATAILRYVERGVVELDAPIDTYLPSLPLPTVPSIRQLLRHTGGIPDYGGLVEYHDAVRHYPGQPWSVDEFLRRTLAANPAWLPGERFAYSNPGYMLLRLLLERVSNSTFVEVLAAEVFRPLGLGQTTVIASSDGMRNLTPGFSTLFGSGDELVDVASIYHPGWVSHGLVASTAPDLARAIDGLFAGRLIGAALLAEMVEPVLVSSSHPLFARPAYGLGLMVDASADGLFVGHGGEGPGYSVGVLHLADDRRRVTSATLVNRDQGMSGLRIAADLARMAAGAGQARADLHPGQVASQ